MNKDELGERRKVIGKWKTYLNSKKCPPSVKEEWEKRCHAKIGKNAMKARARGTEAQKHKCKQV